MTDFVDAIRAFTREQIVGNERRYDALPELPLAEHGRLHELGLANWWVPKEFGGRGVGLEESVDAVAELAYGDAGVAFGAFVSIIGSSCINLFGSDAQKKRFLEPMVTRGAASATLGSERQAGSELLKMTTKAEVVSGKWVIRGEKFFSTNAAFAEHLMVIAAAPSDPEGFRAILVPRGTPGVRIVRRWPVIGVRGSGTYEVAFDGCEVEHDSVLPPNGLRILEIGLTPSRILIASTGVGVARRVRDLCLEYAGAKSLRDSTLLWSPVFAAKLGQMDAEIDAMVALCKAAAREYDAVVASGNGGERLLRSGGLKAALVAKLMCGQIGWKIVSEGSTMFGGLGYTQDHLVEKLTRDMRFISILEGGDDVMRDLLFNRGVLPLLPRR